MENLNEKKSNKKEKENFKYVFVVQNNVNEFLRIPSRYPKEKAIQFIDGVYKTNSSTEFDRLNAYKELCMDSNRFSFLNK